MLKIFNCLKGVRLRHVNFFLLLSVLYLWLIVPGVVSAQVVDIPDPGLRAAIAEALDKAPGDTITRAEMETLVQLWAAFGSITNLSGIEFAINLQFLGFFGHRISDISPLAGLTNLTRLYLEGNSISDISAVESLTNLTELYLGSNTISDISPLASLTNLTRLRLWRNNISDISPLASLTNLTYLNLGANSISDIFPLTALTNLTHLHVHDNNISDIDTLERLIAQGTVVYFSRNPAFETPGPKIEDGWVWLVVPATEVRNGSDAAASGRDFLSEASDGTLTEADVAVNGARAGTRVGNYEWIPAHLDATDPNNLNTIATTDTPVPPAPPVEPPQESGDSVWTAAMLDAIEIDKRNALTQNDTLETDVPYPVAYGVVPIESETLQETRVYIGGGPLKVYLNGTLVHRDTTAHFVDNYQTAVPVQLVPGENVLLIAAYRWSPSRRWGAFFGFQDGTEYTIGSPSPEKITGPLALDDCANGTRFRGGGFYGC